MATKNQKKKDELGAAPAQGASETTEVHPASHGPDNSANGMPMDEPVIVTVPKAFKLRLDHAAVLDVAAGTQKMSREHATHWYSVANGVKIFEG